MMDWITQAGELTTDFISSAGYLGVFVLMLVDSINVPLPSELILGFSGYLVTTGRFSLILAVLAATAGFTAGAAISYWIGLKGGRPIVRRWGKFLLITHRDLARADRLFKRYGNWIAFFSRMIPLLRTFISIPAGVTRMPFGPYIVFSALGSAVWSIVWIYLGKLVGQNYEQLAERFDWVKYVVVAVLAVSIIGWIVHFIIEERQVRREIASGIADAGTAVTSAASSAGSAAATATATVIRKLSGSTGDKSALSDTQKKSR